jgi:hypothetical protein
MFPRQPSIVRIRPSHRSLTYIFVGSMHEARVITVISLENLHDFNSKPFARGQTDDFDSAVTARNGVGIICLLLGTQQPKS